MLLRAGLLLALLTTAHAQPPRSLVLAAISPSSTAALLPEIIKTLDADGKARALAALDRLDRAALDAPALAELSEAYRLLGRPHEALKAAKALSSLDGSTPAGDAQSILALAQTGDYAAAQAAALSGLGRFPGDMNLLGLLHQMKGRGAGAATQPADVSRPRTPSSPAPVPDSRPFVLPIKTSKVGPPPSPAAAPAAEYLSPNDRKSSDFSNLANALYNLTTYKLDVESPAEIRRMAALRVKLEETETGRALVADLGGWRKIQSEVDMRFAAVLNNGTGAYARDFASPDSQGHRSALVLNKKLLAEPDGVVVPILAHELSHIRDFRRQSSEEGLAIPSEFAAHRTQIQVFEELKEKMTPGEVAALKNNARANYQNFIALLWEDHLLQRFKTPIEMAEATGSPKFAAHAKAVFRDLQNGSVAPGGAQLDHHLNAEEDGLYRNLTAERDIVDLIREREASGSYDPEARRKDKEIMAKRAALLAQSDKRDAEFRVKHGFLIGAAK